MIKSRTGAAKGLWNNPGGKLDKDESFEGCAQRETWEETGFTVEIGRLINTYHFQDDKKNRVTKKVFQARIIKGELNLPQDEIEAAKWFTLDETQKMGELEFTFGARKSIQDYIIRKYNQVYNPKRIA